MTPASRKLLLWGPRALALFFCGFLSLFALDVVGEAKGPLETAVAVLMHLIPTLVLLAVVAAAWRWEWIGAAGFIVAAAAYAISVGPRHLDWIAVISVPALLIGAIYLWSWRHHDARRPVR